MNRRTVHAFISLILLVVFLLMLTPSKSDAAPPEEKPHKWLREIGLLSGYGSAPLGKKASEYEVIPLLPQFGLTSTRWQKDSILNRKAPSKASSSRS